MLLEIVILIIGILICGIFFMFICSLFLDNLIDSVINLKKNGLLGDEDNNTQERKDTKEMNKIRQNLKKRINHRNPWNKHVAILEEVGTGYNVLKWKYDNNTVEARSKDVNLLFALRDCIEMYLEETEEHNETAQYKPHKFKRSGYYKVE